nr:RHS repeat-associated core domain-containing protein [Streptomyces sp. SID13726]
MGSSTSYATVTDAYDSHTGDLTDQLVTRSTATPSSIDETAYTYDLSGNTTRQTETRSGSGSTAETQCFTYDTLDRLTTAWTATDNCAATPTSSSHSTVGDGITGGAYWTGWTYDAVGNRLTQTQHTFSGTGSDTVTTSGYSSGQPNTLTSTASTGGSSASTSYGYDNAGNTTTRNTGTGTQTLLWNNSGQLTKVSNATTGTATSYVYDAGGNLLLQTDPTTTTLYLGSEQITLNDSAGTATGVRYYSAPGGATIVRTGTGTAYGFELAADQHGTNSLYLDNTAQTPTWRQFDPYGNPRGTTTSWADNRTFLDKTTDTATGLTDIGAREYDPALGRFTSLDPVFEDDSPQELSGYTYAGDNPVSESDPTGLESCGLAHYCSGSNGTYGTYHPEQDPGSKKYKGSSHYCDTHTCGGTTNSGCYYVLKDPCGTARKSTSWQPVSPFTGWWSSSCATNAIGKLCTAAGVTSAGFSAAQTHLAKYQAAAVSQAIKRGSAEEGMASANRMLSMQNTGTGWSRTALLRPGLTSVGAARALTGAGGVAAYGYNYMTDRGEGQSRTRAALTSVPQAGADMYISATMAESGLETGAILGSFVGPEGTVVGGAVGAVIGLAAGFVTSNVTNNIISDIGTGSDCDVLDGARWFRCPRRALYPVVGARRPPLGRSCSAPVADGLRATFRA